MFTRDPRSRRPPDASLSWALTAESLLHGLSNSSNPALKLESPPQLRAFSRGSWVCWQQFLSPRDFRKWDFAETVGLYCTSLVLEINGLFAVTGTQLQKENGKKVFVKKSNALRTRVVNFKNCFFFFFFLRFNRKKSQHLSSLYFKLQDYNPV